MSNASPIPPKVDAPPQRSQNLALIDEFATGYSGILRQLVHAASNGFRVCAERSPNEIVHNIVEQFTLCTDCCLAAVK